MKNSMQEIVTKTRHLMEAAHTALTRSELQVLIVECIQGHGNRYYRGADKSLARPGRTQATVTEDFDVHICYL
jgi:hypothetical protein